MKQLLFIALGGAAGALARHALGSLVAQRYPGHFPLGTLLINLLGSFAIGLLYVLIVERMSLHADWRSVLMVGFLGAFTTFSTFSLESVNLLLHGQPGIALGYIACSLLGCIAATWLAILLARMI